MIDLHDIAERALQLCIDAISNVILRFYEEQELHFYYSSMSTIGWENFLIG